jgi:hypothetical protein
MLRDYRARVRVHSAELRRSIDLELIISRVTVVATMIEGRGRRGYGKSGSDAQISSDVSCANTISGVDSPQLSSCARVPTLCHQHHAMYARLSSYKSFTHTLSEVTEDS